MVSEHIHGLNRDQTALFPDTHKGYVDKDAALTAVSFHMCYSPLKYAAGPVKRTGVPTRAFCADRFVYDKCSDVYICPAGNRLALWRQVVAHGFAFFAITV